MDPEQSHKVELANLRLQLHALSEKISAESLPAQLTKLRRTILIASFGVAAALVLSGVFHMVGTAASKDIEQRVERLERFHAGTLP